MRTSVHSSSGGSVSGSRTTSRSAPATGTTHAAPTAAFSIDAYARRQKIAAAKQQLAPQKPNAKPTPRSRSSAASSSSSSNSSLRHSAVEYSTAQRTYLDFCIDKFVEPDMKLLGAVRENGFLLQLDAFGAEELDAHMEFLPKSASHRQICLSLGSVEIKRDLRNKFERLGIKKSVAYTEQGAAMVVRSVAAAALKSKHLLRLELAIVSCTKLEFVSFAQTRLADIGLEAMAIALGKCPNLQQLSLAGCRLTNKARDHIAKIITLHGTLKDESVWSSSLRGEAAGVAATRPSLLLDLSQNALGDDAAEAICNALYHDKWLLGLNLSQNRVSRSGVARLTETLSQSNRTLAVVLVNEMRDPVDQASVRTLEALAHERKALLQHLAFENREKRLLLCSVLLEWGVNRQLVLEICQSGTDAHGADPARRRADSSLAPSSVVSGSSASADDQWSHAKAARASSETPIFSSNQEDDGEGDERVESDTDNQSEFATRRDARRLPHDASVNSEAHVAHIQTIKILAERMSAMEEEQRKAQVYLNKLEMENQQLRQQLHATTGASSSSMSSAEERIIARLEDTISSLAQQVGELTLDTAAADITDSPKRSDPMTDE
ncbi:hypothetical protein PybrP1_009092 [[Pythium] brassicae (nom. inval.)]|nr:hypothetical protein PybrP1_009092 [[Pythium] brassicae (nom. inval.)]